MIHYTDPTYMILDSMHEWVGTTRYETFTAACDAAREAAVEGGREYYVMRIEAVATLESRVIDIYGSTWE